MKPNILVIDNEEYIRDMLKDILSVNGYTVLLAEDYSGAISALSQNRVDLILSDIVLEGKTGVDILEKVKEQRLNSPVIMMTGAPDIDTVTESLRLGAFDYIIKPFQITRFLSVVKKALSHKELLDKKEQLEIENKEYREHLENLVNIRTAELELSNEQLRREIAERIKAQELMQIQRDLGIRLNTLHTSEETVRFSFDAVFKTEEIDAGVFFLVDESAKELRAAYHRGLSDEYLELISRHAREEFAFQGKTVFADCDFAEVRNNLNDLKFLAAMPVKHDDHIFALLYVASYRYDCINALLQNALETIASQVGGVLARIRAETALRISDQRREMAMEASSEGAWDYDAETGAVYFGRRWFTILGYTPDELPHSLDTFVSLVHPEDFEAVIKKQTDLSSLSDSFEIEFRMKTKDGKWRWLLSKGKVFRRDNTGKPARIVGTHTDITDRKLAEAEILRANLELDQIFNSTSDGMCMVTDDYRIIRINAAMLKLFNWQAGDVLGQNYFRMFQTTGFRYVGMPESLTLPAFEKIEHDFTVLFPNQTKLFLVLTSVPLKNLYDQREGFLVNIRNITRRVMAEEQAKLKEQQLIRADKMKSLGLLVSGMAHEISNPNNFILLNTSVLSDAWADIRSVLEQHYKNSGDFFLAKIPFSEMQRDIPELLNGIQDGAQRIRTIISSLKEYARGGTADLNEDVSLNTVVKEALLLTDSQIKNSTDDLETESDPQLPMIKGSFHRLEQVIINLIQNACQALPQKNRSIRIKTCHDVSTDKVIVIIRDEGVGIPEESIHSIFDPFFTTKRETGGCGLGLSVCAGIIREHRGEIFFSSEPGKGTSVTLEFPVSRQQKEKDS